MDKQFTASEVHALSDDLRSNLAFNIERCADMLHAFADLLEAQERADPIGWVFQHEDTGRMVFCENDGINNPENFAANNPRHVLCDPAYTHPSPSDAERLAGALQFYANGEHLMLGDPSAWDTVSGEPQNFLCDEAGTATVEDGTIAKQALAAHSAQAQPCSGQSCPHCEPEHGCKLIAQAQPPAARATDDYREIARLIGSIFFAGGFKAETPNEIALEFLLRKTGNWFESWDGIPRSLLAAQEIPND